MKKIRDLLGAALERPDIVTAGRAQSVLRRWSEAVGPLLGEKTVPERYEHGTVWVAASGSAWAQELRLARETILLRLNEMAGERLFQEIRVGTRSPRADLRKSDEA